MISEKHWKILEDANRQLALYFEKLRKARTDRDTRRIKMAEMDYFHALQHLRVSVEAAVTRFES